MIWKFPKWQIFKLISKRKLYTNSLTMTIEMKNKQKKRRRTNKINNSNPDSSKLNRVCIVWCWYYQIWIRRRFYKFKIIHNHNHVIYFLDNIRVNFNLDTLKDIHTYTTCPKQNSRSNMCGISCCYGHKYVPLFNACTMYMRFTFMHFEEFWI